jgi:hypothetical protein
VSAGARTYTAAGIVRYDDKRGLNGRLLGIITFADGKSLKVWEGADGRLHEQCKQLAAFPPHEVRYQFQHSDRWGDSLTRIESTKADHELYDLAMQRDIEAHGTGVKPRSFLSEQLSKGAQRRLDEDRR